MRTQVAIVGAGPAGLLLGALLSRAGVEATVLEHHSREHVTARVRAGMLEHGTVELLRELGVAGRLEREGFEHRSFELRFGRRREHVPMSELTGGRTTWMYGQQEVVKDLIADREQRGDPLVFDAPVLAIEDVHGPCPVVRYAADGRERVLECDVVAGCDGFHGVARDALGERARTFERTYPFAWLGILAESEPATTEELIYAHHPRGFALHSFRSTERARMYLQVPPDEEISRWSDERIWDELGTRFAADDDGWRLPHGPIVDKSVTAMRSFVTEPMRAGRLLLAGDAAHIVPPTAAKGLNLAAADVALAAGVILDHLAGVPDALDRYSAEALRRVWRIEQFSSEMTTMFHHLPADPFDARVQEAQLDRLCDSPEYAAAFCDVYVGLPMPGRPDGAATLAQVATA